MRTTFAILAVLSLCTCAFAQQQATETETTQVTTYEKASEFTLKGPYMIEDATPIPTETFDFRLRFEYLTESETAAMGTDDNFVVGGTLYWGPCNNCEVFLDLPVYLGDSGDTGDHLDGNADSYLGFLYRIVEEDDVYPSFALKGTVRVPTGDRSNGVDGELRGILTKTLTGDLRGHFNAWAATINGNNDPNARHFQWGFALGVDFPLNAEKTMFMVADYVHRSSEHYGASNMNLLEAGLEWLCCPGHRLNFSTQIGLDDNEDTPNFGVMINWVYEIGMIQ